MSNVEHVPEAVVCSTPPGWPSWNSPVKPLTVPAASRLSWTEISSWTALICVHGDDGSLESVDACRKLVDVATNGSPRSTNGADPLAGPESPKVHVVEHEARTASRAWLPRVGTGSPV